MVVLHVKAEAEAPASSSSPLDADEGTEFLYECAASAAVAAALGALAGLQARLLSLCRRLRARCADAGAAAAGYLERELDEAESYASKEQVQHNRFLSPRALREHIKNIEKKCATTLQEPPEALGLQESSSDNKHERLQLWWAVKELSMDHKLCDYIGVNDKTKIVIKLCRSHPYDHRAGYSWIVYGSCPCAYYGQQLGTIMQITSKLLVPLEGDDVEFDSRNGSQITLADKVSSCPLDKNS